MVTLLILGCLNTAASCLCFVTGCVVESCVLPLITLCPVRVVYDDVSIGGVIAGILLLIIIIIIYCFHQSGCGSRMGKGLVHAAGGGNNITY